MTEQAYFFSLHYLALRRHAKFSKSPFILAIGAYMKHDGGYISWLSATRSACDHSKRPDKSFLVKDGFFFPLIQGKISISACSRPYLFVHVTVPFSAARLSFVSSLPYLLRSSFSIPPGCDNREKLRVVRQGVAKGSAITRCA